MADSVPITKLWAQWVQRKLDEILDALAGNHKGFYLYNAVNDEQRKR
jgi:hypothetical protein